MIVDLLDWLTAEMTYPRWALLILCLCACVVIVAGGFVVGLAIEREIESRAAGRRLRILRSKYRQK